MKDRLHEIHATITRVGDRFHAVLTVDGETNTLSTYALEQAHNWVVNRTAKQLLDNHLRRSLEERLKRETEG